jgi:hypothetical protein
MQVDQNKVSEELIIIYMNNIHNYLEIKLTEEENNNITYLDNNDLHLGIHRKPTHTYTTIHFISNHPLEHELPA